MAFALTNSNNNNLNNQNASNSLMPQNPNYYFTNYAIDSGNQNNNNNNKSSFYSNQQQQQQNCSNNKINIQNIYLENSKPQQISSNLNSSHLNSNSIHQNIQNNKSNVYSNLFKTQNLNLNYTNNNHTIIPNTISNYKIKNNLNNDKKKIANELSNPGTNRTTGSQASTTIKNIYPSGILKLNYEIKHRKKEFLQLCMQYDPSYSSYVDKDDFKEILDKFTCYAKIDEKETIVSVFLVENSYVNYINVSSLSIFEEIKYTDTFLLHLNEKVNIPKAALIASITKNINIDTSPLEDLNKRISEENFQITVCKQVMEFIIIHSQKSKADEYFDKVFSELDFDADENFTIGELSNFMALGKVKLSDHDLRFLFESIGPQSGRIPKQVFKKFFYDLYQKTIMQPANTNFSKGDLAKFEILTNEERDEESKIMRIMDENEFIKQILDSIFILGKTFLIKLFSKYCILDRNRLMIDTGNFLS